MTQTTARQSGMYVHCLAAYHYYGARHQRSSLYVELRDIKSSPRARFVALRGMWLNGG